MADPASTPTPTCACWVGTAATGGNSAERRACPVHGRSGVVARDHASMGVTRQSTPTLAGSDPWANGVKAAMDDLLSETNRRADIRECHAFIWVSQERLRVILTGLYRHAAAVDAEIAQLRAQLHEAEVRQR